MLSHSAARIVSLNSSLAARREAIDVARIYAEARTRTDASEAHRNKLVVMSEGVEVARGVNTAVHCLDGARHRARRYFSIDRTYSTVTPEPSA